MKHKKQAVLLLSAVLSLCLCCTACGGSNQTAATFGTASDRNTGKKTQETTTPFVDTATHDTQNASLVIDADTATLDETYDVSDYLYGLFLEDINYAVDGGLYSELIKNRSFEYDELGINGHLNGWEQVGNYDAFVVDGAQDNSLLSASNPTYLRLKTTDGTGIANSGFPVGIAIQKGESYRFSFFAKSPKAYDGNVIVRFSDGINVYGEGKVAVSVKTTWTKYTCTFQATETMDTNILIQILFDAGTIDVDMLSVMPVAHYGTTNVRKDLGEALDDLNPSFLRFPGGCAVEGKTFDSAYDWKDSIGDGEEMTYIDGATGQTVTTTGDVASRPLGTDIWAKTTDTMKNPYYMSYGIGFYEYFELCEDLGAMPVPVLNCGMSCLIQGVSSVGNPAEMVPVTSEKFRTEFLQSAFDLVEFCRGDSSTKYGAIRIAMGHAEPFDLTYVGIGNEQWGSEYYKHYAAFRDAFAEKANTNPALYGDIELIVANGPNSEDTFAWQQIANEGSDYAGLVDEHYYRSPAWFLSNNNRYDSYDRDSVPVFLGEYAAQSNTWEAALAEASYMTGLERNGDIVLLAAYAPLFGNSTTNQWNPDMIYYSNSDHMLTANYYVQQLFSNNKADTELKTELTLPQTEAGLSGKVGIGTWSTAAEFSDLTVTDNKTGAVLYANDFTSDQDFETVAGTWSVANGKAVQSSTKSPSNTITGDVVYLGDTAWKNYTLTLTATKTDGAEGFLIPVCVQDAKNFIHWNIGGWSNTVSCLEQTVANSKSGQISGTVQNIKLETGHAYEIKVVVDGYSIACYLDGKQMVDYSVGQAQALYQTTGVDESGDIIIKLVNPNKDAVSLDISILNALQLAGTAEVTILQCANPAAVNNTAETLVAPKTETVAVSENFTYLVPYYSVVFLRIHQG